MNYFVLMYLVFLASGAIATPHVEFSNNESPDYPTQIETINYEILDISFTKQIVFFRHTYSLAELWDEMGEVTKPYFCTYPGLRDRTAGVMLGVYDLAKKRLLKFFPIYPASYSKKSCAKASDSSKQLKLAKAFVLKNGLNPNTSEIQSNENVVVIKEVNFHRGTRPSYTQYPQIIKIHNLDASPQLMVTSSSIDFTKKSKLPMFNSESNLPVNFKNCLNKNKDAQICDYTMLQVDLKIESEGTKILWQRIHEDSFSMASGGEFTLPLVVIDRKNNQMVAVERFYYFSHRSGIPDYQIFSFTPVLKL